MNDITNEVASEVTQEVKEETTTTPTPSKEMELQAEIIMLKEQIKKLEENNYNLVGEKKETKSLADIKAEEALVATQEAQKYRNLATQQVGEASVISELRKAGVKEELLSFPTKELLNRVEIVETDNGMKAVIDGTQTVEEAVKSFVETEAGKAMLAQPASSGGGSPSFTRSGSNSTKQFKDFLNR